MWTYTVVPLEDELVVWKSQIQIHVSLSIGTPILLAGLVDLGRGRQSSIGISFVLFYTHVYTQIILSSLSRCAYGVHILYSKWIESLAYQCIPDHQWD